MARFNRFYGSEQANSYQFAVDHQPEQPEPELLILTVKASTYLLDNVSGERVPSGRYLVFERFSAYWGIRLVGNSSEEYSIERREAVSLLD